MLCPAKPPAPVRTLKQLLLSIALFVSAACTTTHTHSVEYNGVAGLRGEAVEYQSTTRYALHFLFIFGIVGDAGQDATVDAFTKEASSRGAKRVTLKQTSTSTYWYVFPPLSFLVHPVSRTIYGEVEGTVGEGE